MRWTLLLGIVATLSACPSKEGDSGEGSETGGGDTNEVVDDGVSPSVASVSSVECTTQQSAGEVWIGQILVADPQGAETVDGGTATVLNEAGGELASYSLACGSGQCAMNFRADYDSISCSLDGAITFRFVVTDEEGNASAPYDYATR